MTENRFRVELQCDYEEWWRYNIYISLVSFDSDSKQLDYANLVNETYSICDMNVSREAPEGWLLERKIEISSAPCHYALLYIYIITNTFPESLIIRESPPFDMRLNVERNGKLYITKIFEVNQWGGLTVSELKIE